MDNNGLSYTDAFKAEPRELFSITARDNVFSLVTLAAAVFLAVFGIFGGFALGYSIASTFLIILFTAYFAKHGRIRFFALVYGLLALTSNAVYICTTNEQVRFCSVVTGLLLSLFCFNGIINGSTSGNRRTLGIFYSAASAVANIDISVKSLFAGDKSKKKTVGKVLLGLLCAAPVLIIVVPLLISSDDAFRGMMTKIFDNTFTTLLKAAVGLAICPYLISYGLSLRSGKLAKIKESEFKGIEGVYLVSFMSTICACYLLYLFSQLAYFFSAFSGFLPNGEITYAEYARKGFFEMCIIAVINLAVVFGVMILAKKENGKVSHSIKALATFVSLFTMTIIATAVSKMVLYIDTYGMTVLRITTSAFMLFLSIVFISVILRIYISRINIIKTAVISAGCIVLILGIFNVNAVCARYNYESYKSGRLDYIDVEGLYELGHEGIPYIVKLADEEGTDISNDAKKLLARAYLFDYFDNMDDATEFTVDDLRKNQRDNGFEHYSIPQANAYKCLYEYIEKDPSFSEKCQTFFTTNEKDYYRINW